jgi:hypothetical protein
VCARICLACVHVSMNVCMCPCTVFVVCMSMCLSAFAMCVCVCFVSLLYDVMSVIYVFDNVICICGGVCVHVFVCLVGMCP